MGHRLLKVNESIKETLSSVITAEGLKDPRVGFVTVTGVETARPRHAKVFVERARQKQARARATLMALDSSQRLLQARVNAALHMKRTPQLEFVYDETARHAPAHRDAHGARGTKSLGERAPEILVDGSRRCREERA